MCNSRYDVYINLTIFIIAVLIFPITLILATVYNTYFSIIFGFGLIIDFILFFIWCKHYHNIEPELPIVSPPPTVEVSLHSYS